MPDRDWLQKPPIEPIYRQGRPNQTINLGTHNAVVTNGDTTYKGKATARWKFDRNGEIVFVAPSSGKGPFGGSGWFAKHKSRGGLKLAGKEATVDVLFIRSGDSRGSATFISENSFFAVTPETKSLSRAVFHLLNFPDFHGSSDYILGLNESPVAGGRACGRIIMKSDGWIVTIAAFEDTRNLCEALEKHNGYVITHVGTVEREAGRSFSSKQLQDLMHGLHLLLSLALGSWAGLAMVIGENRSGNRTYELWGSTSVARGAWSASRSWFSHRHADMLTGVFPGFFALWRDEMWKATLQKAIYWYVESNGDNTTVKVHSGVVLAQMALDLLAWTYCVEHRKMISCEAFESRGLSAADRLRLLAASLDVPLSLPKVSKLLNARRGRPWKDSMDAITAIRNVIVHPRRKEEFPHNDAVLESWRISMWYLDLILLRLCGHDGSYINRLTARWVGEITPVPWAQQGSQSGKAT